MTSNFGGLCVEVLEKFVDQENVLFLLCRLAGKDYYPVYFVLSAALAEEVPNVDDLEVIIDLLPVNRQAAASKSGAINTIERIPTVIADINLALLDYGGGFSEQVGYIVKNANDELCLSMSAYFGCNCVGGLGEYSIVRKSEGSLSFFGWMVGRVNYCASWLRWLLGFSDGLQDFADGVFWGGHVSIGNKFASGFVSIIRRVMQISASCIYSSLLMLVGRSCLGWRYELYCLGDGELVADSDCGLSMLSKAIRAIIIIGETTKDPYLRKLMQGVRYEIVQHAFADSFVVDHSAVSYFHRCLCYNSRNYIIATLHKIAAVSSWSVQHDLLCVLDMLQDCFQWSDESTKREGIFMPIRHENVAQIMWNISKSEISVAECDAGNLPSYEIINFGSALLGAGGARVMSGMSAVSPRDGNHAEVLHSFLQDAYVADYVKRRDSGREEWGRGLLY